MKIEVTALSKLKDPNLKNLCQEYVDRINHFHSIKFQEVKDFSKVPEGELILLDESGKNMTSEEFASWLKDQQHQGKTKLSFVIGDATGWPADIKIKYKNKLSLSPMVMQHDIARLVFLEQLYRACTINSGHPYHRA